MSLKLSKETVMNLFLKYHQFSAFILLGLLSCSAAAQNGVQTTAENLNSTSSQLVASQLITLDVVDENFNSTNKIIIDQNEIKKSHAQNLPQLLLSKANISVSSTNVQPNAIFIRGGDSSHVLILVNGVPSYDASSPQRTINLFNMNLSKVKRIEVLKGSQSVIYGGQAFAGVIKIETIADDESSTQIGLETGFHQGHKDLSDVTSKHNNLGAFSYESVSKKNKLSIYEDLYYKKVKTPSPVKDSDRWYANQTLVAGLGLKYQDRLTWSSQLNYSDDDNEITNSNFTNSLPIDATDFHAKTKSYGANIRVQKDEDFEAVVSRQNISRTFYQPAQYTVNGSLTDQEFDGNLTLFRTEGLLLGTDRFKLKSGFQISKEEMASYDLGTEQSHAEAQYEGLYLKSDINLSSTVLLELGAREETSKLTHLAESYQIGLTQKTDINVIKAEYSTGFKTPSLFQLYAGQYGNSSLQPEKAKNVSLTLEHHFNKNIYSSVVFFGSSYENLIDYNYSISKYSNISETNTQGVELFSSVKAEDGFWSTSISLGYQEPKDMTKGTWLVRRSLRSGNLKVQISPTESLNIGSEVNHVGSKMDKSGSSFIEVSSYTLLNVFMNYKINSEVSTYFRADNITDETYYTTYGYTNNGVVLRTGLNFNL